ncbi:hypothetical protein CYMTET_2905 [Cymbomonas tetramitiformis]|uniref:RNase H type-1 domain-containing protein n=1 Tax=Cymbomonas tetramitiformis TaxID=36881 RepID=A0AAE0H4S3_9CHLO|nr:hypothetical protein CYMTET_2905 [Cymbomonas tetramitiformis]
MTSDGCILLPVGETIDCDNNDAPPINVKSDVQNLEAHYDYIADRQKEILSVQLRNRTADEESAYSCPSNSDENDNPSNGNIILQDHYDMASDGSLFAGKKAACSGAAYLLKERGDTFSVRKANIPASSVFNADDRLIKADIQTPSSTSAEIIGLRFLLEDQKDHILKSVTPMVHAIDSMATITAVNKDRKTVSAREKLREPNRRELQAVRLILEELGFYSGEDHSRIILKWIRGHNNDRLHDRVDRAAKRASFRKGANAPRFDPYEELPYSFFYMEVPVAGDIRNHIRRTQRLTHLHTWKAMSSQGKYIRMLAEDHNVPSTKDISKVTAKAYTAARSRELLGLQASTARSHKLGVTTSPDCPYCQAGTKCNFSHIQLECPGPGNSLVYLRGEQDDELKKHVAAELSGEPKLLNPGKGSSFIDICSETLGPLADLRDEMKRELYLQALPESGMYRPSASKKGTIAVTALPDVNTQSGNNVYPELQCARKQEFWKLLSWHYLSKKELPSPLSGYATRAHDIHTALKACRDESGDPKNCYAIRRSLLDIIIDDRGLNENGCELFCNPLNSQPRIHSRTDVSLQTR